jgi:hypothetical protein
VARLTNMFAFGFLRSYPPSHVRIGTVFWRRREAVSERQSPSSGGWSLSAASRSGSSARVAGLWMAKLGPPRDQMPQEVTDLSFPKVGDQSQGFRISTTPSSPSARSTTTCRSGLDRRGHCSRRSPRGALRLLCVAERLTDGVPTVRHKGRHSRMCSARRQESPPAQWICAGSVSLNANRPCA